MKTWIKPILVIFAIVVLFIGINSICIYKYLSEYGYGIKELPQTVAVWLRLSDGFTVEVNDDEDSHSTLFIGHSDIQDYIKKYEKVPPSIPKPMPLCGMKKVPILSMLQKK